MEKIQVNFRLFKPIWAKLKKLSKKEGMTMTAYITKIIDGAK